MCVEFDGSILYETSSEEGVHDGSYFSRETLNGLRNCKSNKSGPSE